MRTLYRWLSEAEFDKAYCAARCKAFSQATAAKILEAMRRHLGADYKPIVYPPDWFVKCSSTAERILRARQFMMEQQENGARRREEPSQNTFR